MGIYDRKAGFLESDYILSAATQAAQDGIRLDTAGLVVLAPGADKGQVQKLIAAKLVNHPDAKILTQKEYEKDTGGFINQLLIFVTVMLLLAVLIALLGIVNTLALSVYERTRELGLLRAVGMTRGQVRAMVRWESVVISFIGAIAGAVLGIGVGVAARAGAEGPGHRLDRGARPAGGAVRRIGRSGRGARRDRAEPERGQGGRADYSSSMALRVVFADDSFLVRQGVAALLAEVDDVELVDSLVDSESLVESVARHQPDVALTDIRMPPSFTTEGIDAAKRIRAEHPSTGVVVLSQYVEEEYAFELLANGVSGLGYLLKERVSQVDELVHALREVARGGSALDPKVVEALMARKDNQSRSPLSGLTDREREVLESMATGRNNATIATDLSMSERAVEKHVGSIFQKLGLISETQTNRRVMAVLAFLEATS